jgi:CubicO group peptidase (beta-lactamase class C family)
MSGAALDRVEETLVPFGDGASALYTTIRERMAFYRARALSLAVIDSFDIVAARAYSASETDGAAVVDTSTLFQAASISKPVTAMAVMKLVEQEKLALDEAVNDRLTSWKIPSNQFTESREVTARQLLSHTAGATVHGFPGYEPGRPLPELLQVLDGLPPANTEAIRIDAVPGTAWRYSGGGFTILQQLLVDVFQKSFPALMREVVLDPLAMAESTFYQPLPENFRERAAPGGLASGEVLPGMFRIHPEMAAAGLWTTPSDLARFAIELQLSTLDRSDRVLSQARSSLMMTPQRVLPTDLAAFLGSHSGLGIFLNGEERSRWFSHAGGNAGYVAYMIADFSGHGAVIMTSSEAVSLVVEILSAIAREYHWRDFSLPKFPTTTPTVS